MQTLNLFSDHAFDLSSKMSTVEKQSIALQYLTTETVNNIKDDIIASSMLPLLCRLYRGSSVRYAPLFFKNPYDVYNSEFDEWWREKKY